MKKESGITLVALIITVIILVILSAVTIITLQQSEIIKYDNIGKLVIYGQ